MLKFYNMKNSSIWNSGCSSFKLIQQIYIFLTVIIDYEILQLISNTSTNDCLPSICRTTYNFFINYVFIFIFTYAFGK